MVSFAIFNKKLPLSPYKLSANSPALEALRCKLKQMFLFTLF
jgi:hypothetical protein